jgi:hypothetical protein
MTSITLSNAQREQRQMQTRSAGTDSNGVPYPVIRSQLCFKCSKFLAQAEVRCAHYRANRGNPCFRLC